VAASSSSSPPSTSTLTTSTDYSSDFSLGIQTDMDDLKHNVHSKPCYDEDEIRFTKVLTKYSTEYNNYMFIQNLCIQMLMDKNDLITYFLHVRSMNKSEEDICSELEQYSVSKLDVSRMFRYLDKYRT
jgi:hypothetical protein